MVSEVSIDDQIKCVRRELAMRKTVYPKWTASGKMKPEAAERELAAMQAVHDTLTSLKLKQSDLFEVSE